MTRLAVAGMTLSVCSLFAAAAIAGNEQGPTPQAVAADKLQRLYADLQKAIQTRNYGLLQEERGEPSVRWTGPDGLTSDISAKEAIARLRSAATGSSLRLIEGPVERSGIVILRTEGWAGKDPFRHLQFTPGGRNQRSWRWSGCTVASRRDVEGGMPVEGTTARMLRGVEADVEKAAAAGDFAILKRYVPDRKPFFFVPCGPGEEVLELDENEMTTMLVGQSGQGEILFDPYPDVHDWGGSAGTTVSIDTEGWTGEYPFLGFTFAQRPGDPAWRWEGVCYDVLPPIRNAAESGRPYFSKPVLPRPGPRVFRDDAALRARISEIVEFGEWDALQVYAHSEQLTFGECSREMLEEDRGGGKSVPAAEVIEFLRKNAAGAGQITETKVYHPTFYESEGWQGEFPYVQFWFFEGRDGWRFDGVTYCRQKMYDVPPDDAPWYKKAFRSMFR